jgi:hypothetical protein
MHIAGVLSAVSFMSVQQPMPTSSLANKPVPFQKFDDNFIKGYAVDNKHGEQSSV